MMIVESKKCQKYQIATELIAKAWVNFMTLNIEGKPSAEKLYSTNKGRLYLGRCESVFELPQIKRLKKKVNLIFTSPPFPLNVKKRYGNLQGEEYLKWLSAFGPLFSEMLTDDGSVVMEVGNAWEPGSPVQSVLPYKSLLGFLEAGGFKLCQEITYYNPARLPSPAQWVTVNRIRLKDSTTKIWWMSKSERPKADNRRVLKPYSEHMIRLLAKGKYNSGNRPSQHQISKTGFLKNNEGAIAPNLIQASNTHSNLAYQKFCKEQKIMQHPARMPEKLAEFFIKFLTDEGDLVLDPFAGSNTTGATAQRLKRRWLSIEALPLYAAASISHFDQEAAAKIVKRFHVNNNEPHA
jgi:DNA modification methylase